MTLQRVTTSGQEAERTHHRLFSDGLSYEWLLWRHESIKTCATLCFPLWFLFPGFLLFWFLTIFFSYNMHHCTHIQKISAASKINFTLCYYFMFYCLWTSAVCKCLHAWDSMCECVHWGSSGCVLTYNLSLYVSNIADTLLHIYNVCACWHVCVSFWLYRLCCVQMRMVLHAVCVWICMFVCL